MQKNDKQGILKKWWEIVEDQDRYIMDNVAQTETKKKSNGSEDVGNCISLYTISLTEI